MVGRGWGGRVEMGGGGSEGREEMHTGDIGEATRGLEVGQGGVLPCPP